MRAADEAAYADFVLARQTHLRRIAYAICGDWHRADDLLQIALVKLYAAWPRVDLATAEAFTRRILVRADVDERRRPWRREVARAEPDDRPARGEVAYEERSALVEALQDLPVMQRKVVVLRHWLGLSVGETAAELDISPGTVKSHCSRGLARLQERMTKQADGPQQVASGRR